MKTTTGANGEFELAKIPAGKYVIEAAHSNYQPWSKKIKIKRNIHHLIRLKSE